jgi:hypothetical protein
MKWHYTWLNPKGLNVLGVTYDLTLFLDFLKVFVKMRVGISFVWAQSRYPAVG